MTMSRKSMIKPYKHCKKCGALIVSGDLCEDCKPITNGDKIRAMTDEELAEMVSMQVCRIVKPDGNDCPKGFYFGKCDKCVLKWLKQEVSEDTGTDD